MSKLLFLPYQIQSASCSFTIICKKKKKNNNWSGANNCKEEEDLKLYIKSCIFVWVKQVIDTANPLLQPSSFSEQCSCLQPCSGTRSVSVTAARLLQRPVHLHVRCKAVCCFLGAFGGRLALNTVLQHSVQSPSESQSAAKFSWTDSVIKLSEQ